MLDLCLFRKNDNYNIYEKKDANIRNELNKPLFIQKLTWYLLVSLYIFYILFNSSNTKIINGGLLGIEIVLISQLFIISKRSMYVYKLKIESDSEAKKILYSKYIFTKWMTLINNFIIINCIIFYKFGFKICADILIIILILNIIRLLIKLATNKFRLFMIKETLKGVIEESEESRYDNVDLNELIDDGEDMEIVLGGRYYAINKTIKSILIKVDEVTQSEKNSIYSKSQLVTNLSHDLKTPLTSIINSIYIMKNEELTKEESKEQISILKEKSTRLKSLIENLNEVINSQENEIILNKEYINIEDLIEECIDGYKEKLRILKLDVKLKSNNNDLIVYMDKDKTIRIFENLLDNIIKYSLEDTRVYIDIIEDGSIIDINLKNICKYELEVNNKLLGDRFIKGDKSRNGEGYGLGLSIVKNLIRVQGGKVQIFTEGDLFKINLRLKKHKIT